MLAADAGADFKSAVAASSNSAAASPWICCQIGSRQHYGVARALSRQDALKLLITDAWLRPGNPLGALSGALRSRFHPELEKAEVYGSAVRNIAFELRARYAMQAGWPVVMARNRWFQRVALSKLSQI